MSIDCRKITGVQIVLLGFWESLIGHKPEPEPVGMWKRLIVIGNSIGQLATIRGLDVSLGFLHIPLKGRPSLALDLVEPVRPWVDQWLWQNIQKTELLTPKHFTLSNELGSRLNKEARSIFFPAWYDDAESWLLKPMRDSLAALFSRQMFLQKTFASKLNYEHILINVIYISIRGTIWCLYIMLILKIFINNLNLKSKLCYYVIQAEDRNYKL